MSLRVLRPGLHTTVQDLGRYGMQHLGVVPCGAMDPIAHRLANALVGNDAEAATLECTVVGPELRFERPALIALCGANFDARIAGEALPQYRPVWVKKGVQLRIGQALRGARGYLAVAGGVGVPAVLGSRSSYVPAGFGGLQGRALRAGDTLALDAATAELGAERFSKLREVRATAHFSSTAWQAPVLTLPRAPNLTLRAIEGRHYGQFEAESRRAFFEANWRVSQDSNRMGYRLAGPALARESVGDLLSEPTCLGTVQAPGDGSIIVLMADHQTTGGYPKIAELAGADMPLLAQLAPGGMLRFQHCSVEDARAALQHTQARLAAIIDGIHFQYGD